MLVLTMSFSGDENEELVGYVYKHYLNNMFACAKSILGNESDAEEAIFDSLAKLYYTKVKVRNIESKEGLSFVLAVVKNVCLDKIRKKEKESVLYYGDEELMELESSQVPRTSAFTVDDIMEAIKELDDEYRDILTMSAVDGLSSSQIAKLVGLKPNTVRARLKKAREILKKKLEERGIFI